MPAIRMTYIGETPSIQMASAQATGIQQVMDRYGIRREEVIRVMRLMEAAARSAHENIVIKETL